jgi:hypothetical protein
MVDFKVGDEVTARVTGIVTDVYASSAVEIDYKLTTGVVWSNSFHPESVTLVRRKLEVGDVLNSARDPEPPIGTVMTNHNSGSVIKRDRDGKWYHASGYSGGWTWDMFGDDYEVLKVGKG